ncbi:MAG: hypothetical protein ABUL44_00075, partial [Flavobacterium sp.]
MTDETPREALSRFYAANRLGKDGGIAHASVRIELSRKVHMYYPNFNARRKAVLKHDIHHLLTGYSTKLKGECEICAWEIGSGCKKYWGAFVLDTSGLVLGIPFYFRRTLRAFARGRKTKNLYTDFISNDEA